jgi:hypothetical protein
MRFRERRHAAAPQDVSTFLRRTEFVIDTVDVRISKISNRTPVESRRWLIGDENLDSTASSVATYLATWNTAVDATITAFDRTAGQAKE